MVMKCKAVIREIEEMERGASASAEASAHLLSCESCSAFSRERAQLRMLVGSLGEVSAPPDFDWRLKARLTEARTERAVERRFLQGFAPGAQAITLAACATLLLVGVVVYRQTRPLPVKGTESASITGVNRQANPVKENKEAVEAKAPSTGLSYGAGQPGASTETRRGRAIKSTGKSTAVSEGSGEPAPRERIYSTDMGSRAAEDVTARNQVNAYNATAPVISVRLPSAAPAQLKVEDGQGTRRTLSTINFGGQELIERPNKARLVPVSEKGIW